MANMATRSYEPDRLFGAPTAFASGDGFLLSARPDVLSLDLAPMQLQLPGLDKIAPPLQMVNHRAQQVLEASAEAERANGKVKRHKKTVPVPREARLWNPSIIRAPSGLCPRCAYIATYRVDTLHQCSRATSPYTPSLRGEDMDQVDWFQGTAVALLDERFANLGWTWFLNSPGYQVASSTAGPDEVNATACVPLGAADHAFAPSWAKQTYDARLFAVPNGLVMTYACSSCVFSVSPVRITADVAPDGGITNLRAWSTARITYQRFPWLAGRNQALFSYPPSGLADTTTPTVYVQSRLGLIGRLGSPHFERASRPTQCMTAPGQGVRRRRAEKPRGRGSRPGEWSSTFHNCRSDNVRGIACGSSPDGSVIEQWKLDMQNPAALRSNRTRELAEMLRTSGNFGGLSLTSHLVHVSPKPNCEAYLGVGHLHRGEGVLNKYMYRRRPAGPPPWRSKLHKRQPFAFGYRYTHFWYVLQPRPPFATLAVSREFCLASPQNPQDCESIQFVSGLALQHEGHGGHRNASSSTGPGTASSLLVAYGVNDCEARLGAINLERIWKMLVPLPQSLGGKPTGICE